MTDSPASEPGPSASATVDGVDVDAVVAAVASCPSVSGLAAGGLGSAMTLLPGRRVAGVQVLDDEVRVEVRARWGATAAMLATEVQASTRPLLAGHRLHVLIADIDTPLPEAPVTPATPAPTAGRAVPRALPSAPAVVAQSPADTGSPAGTARPADTSSSSSFTEAPSAPSEAAGSETDPSDRPASPS